MTDMQKYISGKLMLAPMAGTTDFAFRSICKSFGAALTHTEMVSARGMSFGSSFSARCAVLDPAEHPAAIQIFGSNGDLLKHAIDEVSIYKPDVIDINAGCPAEMVTKAGAGAALLANITALQRMIRAAVQSTTIPVSVKIRAALHPDRHIVSDVARALEDTGIAWLTVHGRARFMLYDQPARWDWVREAKNAVSIPVVGNGDIFSAEDAVRMMRETACDAVLVARGSLGSPWIFREFERLSRGEPVIEPTNDEVRETMLNHLRLLVRDRGEIMALPRLRKHLCWYARYFERSEEFRASIFAHDSIPHVREAIESFFAATPRRLEKNSEQWKRMETAFRKRVLYWIADDFTEM